MATAPAYRLLGAAVPAPAAWSDRLGVEDEPHGAPGAVMTEGNGLPNKTAAQRLAFQKAVRGFEVSAQQVADLQAARRLGCDVSDEALHLLMSLLIDRDDTRKLHDAELRVQVGKTERMAAALRKNRIGEAELLAAFDVLPQHARKAWKTAHAALRGQRGLNVQDNFEALRKFMQRHGRTL